MPGSSQSLLALFLPFCRTVPPFDVPRAAALQSAWSCNGAGGINGALGGINQVLETSLHTNEQQLVVRDGYRVSVDRDGGMAAVGQHG